MSPRRPLKIKQTPQASITYRSFTVLLFQNGKLTAFFVGLYLIRVSEPLKQALMLPLLGV